MGETVLETATPTRVEYIESYTLLPTGMAVDDWDAPSFATTVSYRGEFNGKSGGGWAVTQGARQLSRTLNWGFPQKFQRWQYRFKTFDEAVAAARSVADKRIVNGRTWAEWQAHRQTLHELDKQR